MVKTPDFGKTAVDYRKYRQGFPEQFFTRLINAGIGLPNQKVLDLGTGTGTVARGFALQGCEVTAIDPSIELIEQAKVIDSSCNVTVNYFVGTAEDTKQADNQFDIVVAGQAWHWFKHDQAIDEVKRVLKPDGKLIIAHYDWIPVKNSVPALSEAIILKYNPAWKMSGGNGFYPQWVTQLVEAGFETVETYSFDVVAEYTHEAWRGRIRASAGVAASLSEEDVAKFDAEHSEALKIEFPDDPLRILHRCFTVTAKLPTLFKHNSITDSESGSENNMESQINLEMKQ